MMMAGELDMFQAAAEGRTELILDNLVSSKAHLFHITEHGTPMHFAAINGHINIVAILLQSGMDVNARRADNITSLHLAAKHGHLEIVNLLLLNGAWINALDHDGVTPLILSIREGHNDISLFLLSKGADFNIRNKSGFMAIHLATFHRRNVVVEALIKYGADISSAATTTGCTPMLCTSLTGNVELLNIFLHHNADINIQSRKTGNTPLHSATLYDKKDAVALLLKHGGDPNIKNLDGISPLQQAQSLEVLLLLLEGGANVLAADNDGNTALHDRVVDGPMEMIEALLRFGADVNRRNSEGRTPLHIAAEAGRVDAAALLLRKGAIADVVDDYGDAAMDLIVSEEGKQLVERYCNWSRRRDLVLCLSQPGTIAMASRGSGTSAATVMINNADVLQHLVLFL